MPDLGGLNFNVGTGAGFYLDATNSPWDRNYRMYSYVVNELPAAIEAKFPALPDARGIFARLFPLLLVAGDAEALAPLRTTTTQHLTSTWGSPTGAKSVRPLPLDLAGLIGPLHDSSLPRRRRLAHETLWRIKPTASFAMTPSVNRIGPARFYSTSDLRV